MVDQDAIRELLDGLRFDEAEEAASDSDPDSPVHTEISKRRAAAEEEARDLGDRIATLSAEARVADLADIAEDHRALALIALLESSARRQAEMHVDEARRWKAYKQKAGLRHLAEARTALESLDVELARGLVNKVDGRFLTDEQAEQRDRLLLDISARSMELESLDSTAQELIAEAEPKFGSKSWWRRWFG